jgi:1-aminocyclopropane-1-carboxylate deaminase/D-cysteine desulfhydrase-like pyridoxal-dependent ACC family enzyme
MTRNDLVAALNRLPRVPFAATPTPLEAHPELGRAIGLDRLLVKRDDLTGLAFGGNKVRELEYFLGAAVAADADVFVAGGGVAQSNHARQCAAAARRAGLEAHLVLRATDQIDETTGNLLVTRLLADEIILVDDDPGLADRESLSATMDAHAELLRGAGRRPWVLHSSFHPLGAAAYVAAGIELADQLADLGISAATIVVTSMGATRVGFDLAAAVLGLEWTTVGVGWRPVDNTLTARLVGLATETADLLGLDPSLVEREPLTLDHGGPSYGVPSDEGLDAIRLAARISGLLLDPVYTAKGFAGLRSAVGASVDPHRPVVFVHTGGLPALFTHGNLINAAI